jgi:hypothetical protein
MWLFRIGFPGWMKCKATCWRWANRITRDRFAMRPGTEYRIVVWDPAQQFLIARADSVSARPKVL